MFNYSPASHFPMVNVFFFSLPYLTVPIHASVMALPWNIFAVKLIYLMTHFRTMLEETQNKVLTLRKELQAMHSAAESLCVLNTLADIPGVSAESLIEVMSGRIIASNNDLNAAKALAAQSQAEVQKLKRIVGLLTQSQAERTVTSVSRGRSESPRIRRGASLSVPVSESQDASLRTSVPDFKHKDREALTGPRRRMYAGGLSEGKIEKEKGIGRGVKGVTMGSRGITFRSDVGELDDAANTTALSLVVDGDTTPQILLEALNAATMAQSMRSQAALIVSLRGQLDDAHEGILHAESAKLNDVDELEGRDRIEIESTHRRLELLQAAHDYAQDELVRARKRCSELEIEAMTRSVDPVHHTSNTLGVTDFAFALSQLSNEREADTSTENPAGAPSAEEDRAEVGRTRSLLRERTAQLKILMETLDSLQQAGVKPAKGSRGSKEHPESLFFIADTPVRCASDEPWGMQCLVKRVVELTAELTSQSATTAIEERRAVQLEDMGNRKSREINQLKGMLKQDEESRGNMRLNLISLSDRIKETEQRRAEEGAAMRLECDSLIQSLKESEAESAALQVTVSELSQQIKLSEEVDIRQWLEGILSRDAAVCDAHVDNYYRQHVHSQSRSSESSQTGTIQRGGDRDGTGAGAGSMTVRGLVLSLLAQWGEGVGAAAFIRPPSHLSGPPGTGTGAGMEGTERSLTKAEQRFYQSVADLTMAADERGNRGLSEARAADVLRIKAELSLKVCQDRLRGTVQHLYRYRKRAYACEQSARMDRKHKVAKESKLTFLLNKSLSEQRSKVNMLTNSLFEEKKARQSVETSRSLETLQLRQLQLKVAELEARGGAVLRGRDDALAGVEDRVKAAEESFHKWAQVELPRLLNGLPLEEESMATFFDSPHAHTRTLRRSSGYSEGKEDIYPSGASGWDQHHTGTGAGSGGGSGSMPFDRTYALAQSLCVCKTAQAAQDMRISTLLEKNFILKERAMEVQGLLRRWGADIEATAVLLTRTAALEGAGNRVSDGSTVRADGTVQAMTAELMEMQRSVTETERVNIELKGSLDQALSQLKEQSNLVDLLTSEEDVLQRDAVKDLTRLRNTLQTKHFKELQSQTIRADEEKRVLKVGIVQNRMKMTGLGPT
jgi:hypothetical protein